MLGCTELVRYIFSSFTMLCHASGACSCASYQARPPQLLPGQGFTCCVVTVFAPQPFFKAMAARKVSKAKRVKTQVKRRHASGPEKLPRDKSQKAVYGRGKLPDKALAAPRRVPFAPSAPLPGLLAKLFLALAWWA